MQQIFARENCVQEIKCDEKFENSFKFGPESVYIVTIKFKKSYRFVMFYGRWQLSDVNIDISLSF
jgi:exonuclease III